MNLSVAHSLIQCIEMERKSSPDSVHLCISSASVILHGFNDESFLQTLRSFALEKALSFEITPKLLGFRMYTVQLLPGYEVYKSDVLERFYGKKPLETKLKSSLTVLPSTNPLSQKGLVSIRFDDLSRHILLNDCFLIAQPAYDSENYRFFEYVWKHPDRLITLEEFNQNLEEPLKKPIGKILENLNFRGPLKDAFFQVSKTSVLFTPVRTVEALTAAGLYPLRLFSTQRAH